MPIFIKAIIFDLDGVIVNSNPAIELFWKNWTDREGILLTDDLIRKWIHGRKVGDTLLGLFSGVSAETKVEIQQSAYEFDKRMEPVAIQGVAHFIKSIQSLQIPIGIVTSSHYERMWNMLQKLALENLFSHFVTAQDVTKGKPDPEPYEAMSKKMGIAVSDCLVFEDAISGIQSASAAGMHSIGIGDQTARKDLLLHGARDVIVDFYGIQLQHTTLSTLNGTIFKTGGSSK